MNTTDNVLEQVGDYTTVACPERPTWATRLLEGEVEPVLAKSGRCISCGEDANGLEWKGSLLCNDCAVPANGSPVDYIAAYYLFCDGVTREQAILAIQHADLYCGADCRGGNWGTGYQAAVLRITG